jgi:glyoxylase-like metal-dependent hydrolase (beta-lactamase superfamily II)
VICEDERQYVGWEGQRWTTLGGLRAEGHSGDVREEAPGVYGVGTTPSFAIGQRALLVPGPGGNLLWDCVSHLDDETVERIRGLGGIAAIAISHPHFYGSMIEWSEAFGGVPVYVHAADAQWVRRDGNVVLWEGDTVSPLPGRTLVNCGVHFAGGTVLHWPGPDGRGALASGDIFMVVSDRRWVSFMYSYPNLIPEHPDTIARALALVEPYEFAAIYGAWWGRVVGEDAKAALHRSARRYRRHIGLE